MSGLTPVRAEKPRSFGGRGHSAPRTPTRRLTDEERAAVIVEFHESGESVRNFCKARGIAKQSLYRWLANARPRENGERGRPLAIEGDAELCEYVMGRMARQPRARATHLWREMVAKYGNERTPSIGAVRNYMKKTRRHYGSALAKMGNPREFKNRWKPAFGKASAGVSHPNEVWEIDSTPADVLTTGGRANIVGIIDIATRRLCLHASESSDSNAVMACIRKAIRSWGLPGTIISDNGKDYVSRHVRGALARLGITHRKAPFRTPEQKAHIERAFGTLTRDLFERMDNYAGHNVAEHKDIVDLRRESERRNAGGRIMRLHEPRLTLAEFQEEMDKWVSQGYEHRAHSGLAGKTPAEAAAAMVQSIRMVPERALDILLMKSERRMVSREGVNFKGLPYIHEKLGEHIGERIEVRASDDEMGKLFCFEERGRFICKAENAEGMGIERKEVARRARERQAERNQNAIAQFKSMAGALDTGDVLREINGEEQKVVDLRPAEIVEFTPAVAEALRAGKERETEAAPLTAEEEQAAAAFSRQ